MDQRAYIGTLGRISVRLGRVWRDL